MLNKNKFYIGITLLAQATSFLAMFLMLFRKKKSLSKAVLAVSVISGAIGAFLLYLDSKDELKRRKIIAARDACCAEDFDDSYIYDDYEYFDEDDVPVFEDEDAVTM